MNRLGVKPRGTRLIHLNRRIQRNCREHSRRPRQREHAAGIRPWNLKARERGDRRAYPLAANQTPRTASLLVRRLASEKGRDIQLTAQNTSCRSSELRTCPPDAHRSSVVGTHASVPRCGGPLASLGNLTWPPPKCNGRSSLPLVGRKQYSVSRAESCPPPVPRVGPI